MALGICRNIGSFKAPTEIYIGGILAGPFKKAVDREGLPEETTEAFDRLTEEEKQKYGIAHRIQCEPVPAFALYNHEKSIDNAGNYQNSRILFTRDRPGGFLSGYGGRGDTQCSTIDIVAGFQSSNAREVNKENEKLFVNPNFIKDAARIYISQKTDVDTNFFISKQPTELNRDSDGPKRPTSAIAIKADDIRIIAREKIKLVTGTDSFNSQGGKVLSTGGIDLIAGNIAGSTQPLVLGHYLTDALKNFVFLVDQLNGIVNTFVVEQKAFNDAVTNHTHFSPFYYAPTSVSFPIRGQGQRCSTEIQNSTLEGLKTHKDALSSFRSNYLEIQGGNYINSPFNTSN